MSSVSLICTQQCGKKKRFVLCLKRWGCSLMFLMHGLKQTVKEAAGNPLLLLSTCFSGINVETCFTISTYIIYICEKGCFNPTWTIVKCSNSWLSVIFWLWFKRKWDWWHIEKLSRHQIALSKWTSSFAINLICLPASNQSLPSSRNLW